MHLIYAIIVFTQLSNCDLRGFSHNCFITFVKENQILEYNLYHSIIESSQNTFAFYNTIDLELGFSAEFLLDDNFELSLNFGFYRFFFRHSKLCILYIIATETLNGTLTAIQTSGYGTSDNAMYLILASRSPNSETFEAFKNGFVLQSIDIEFNANIAFFQIQPNGLFEIYAVYCYTCDNKIVYANFGAGFSSIWEVYDFSITVNRNSHGHGGILYGQVDAAMFRQTFSINYCNPSNGLALFFKNIVDCLDGESVGLVVATNFRNVTITEFRWYGDEKQALDGLRLNIKPAPYFEQATQLTILIFRWKTSFFRQRNYNLIYCKNINSVLYRDWTIYFTALDWEIWGLILVVLLTYGIFVYKNLALMVDLLCPLLGFPFVLKQPRKFICSFVIGILFITCFYSAGMSTQFMFTDDEGTILDYFKHNYKIYVNGFQNIDIYVAQTAEHQQLGLRKMSQMRTAREVFYHDKN